jgi:phosphoserine aminotransferase
MTTDLAVQRVFNFASGPAVLPLEVLNEIQANLLALPGVGSSILEISHRSDTFIEIMASAEKRIRRLLSVPENYRILFLQGGSRLQFSMIPMNLLRGSNKTARYIVSGSWSKMALDEAKREGATEVIWDDKANNYSTLPASLLKFKAEETAYVYYTSNETIQGVQFSGLPPCTGNLICDASSDFLSRPIDISAHGIVYACAQKNAGPSGVTIVIIRDDLLKGEHPELGGYMNYRSHAENDSMYNTPPTFAIYVVELVAKWLEQEIGGLQKMDRLNQQKSALLYQVIDQAKGFYVGHARTDCRSKMNVTFRFADEKLEKPFLEQAEKNGLTNLKGHRSVGGMRASIYNAMPLAGVEALAELMKDFANKRA